MRWILFSVISVFFCFKGNKHSLLNHENLNLSGNLITQNDSILDSCIIDFRIGLIGTKPVYLGKTKFKEIKKMYGDAKAVNERAFFSTVDGFFSLSSKLEYPEKGMTFLYNTGCHQRGQRSFFQNHTVNVISLDSNSNCKTAEGVGIGSRYSEIKNALSPDDIIFMRSSEHAEVNCTIYLSEKEKIYVNFNGNYCKDTSEFLVKEIIFFIYERN